MLAAMVAEVDRGGLRDAKASVAELLERWFDHARENFSSTERETRAVLDRTSCPPSVASLSTS